MFPHKKSERFEGNDPPKKKSKKEKIKSFFMLKRKSPKAVPLFSLSPLVEPEMPSGSGWQTPVDPVSNFLQQRPTLRINTAIPTPPPTPDSSYQVLPSSSTSTRPSSLFERRPSSIKSVQTPTSSSPVTSPTSRRRSSVTSLNFLKTPRQRKLQEIREGKLPAKMSDEIETPTATAPATEEKQEKELLPEDICDPSSSTTYNPENRRKKSLSLINGTQTTEKNPLPPFMKMPLSFT